MVTPNKGSGCSALANLTVIAVKKTAYFYSNMAPKREKDIVYPF